MPEAKRRFRSAEFRVEQRDDATAAVEGYAALFNEVTDLFWFTESIAPGAFSDTLERSDDVRALFNHDPNIVLGRSKADTLELREDEKGLFTKIYPPNTEQAKGIVESIRRGDISQMSFGFIIDEEEVDYSRDSRKPHVTVKRVTLFDVSPVTFPAYEGTEIAIARSLETEKSLKARLDKLLSAQRDSKAEQDHRARAINVIKSRFCA